MNSSSNPGYITFQDTFFKTHKFSEVKANNAGIIIIIEEKTKYRSNKR
jgi:hypothetical protein